jgi:citrate lyase subunit beta/citryl-CoA lyase
MRGDLPIWRSLLFVPVIQPRFVAGAADRGADAIILDLEDSVPAAEKVRARGLVQEATELAARKGADVLVRINRPLRSAIADLEAAISPRVAALMLPKTESAEHVGLLSEAITELEAERGMPMGTTRLVAMIETPSAFFRMAEIARSSPRLVAMTVGGEDLALALEMEPSAEALLHAKQQMILAARAAGILPLGFVGSIAGFADRDAFRETIRRARRLGFAGSPCIHPAQVAILNEEFRPSEAEVAEAERILTAYEDAADHGNGAIALDGKMIDRPVVERARCLLSRYAAILARDARKSG